MRTISMLGLVLGLGLMGAWGAEAPKNLIANGSFEGAVDEHGVPKGWWGPGGDPAEGYKVTVVAGGRMGGKALQIEGIGKYGLASADRIEIDRSKRYTAHGFFKVEGEDAKATIKFDYFDAQGAYVGSTDYGQLGPSPAGWRMVSIQDRAESFPKAKTLGVVLVLLGKGAAVFDEIELTTGPAASTNLLPNGGMENVLGDQVVAYWTSSNEGGKASWTASTDRPKEGRYCLHVKGSCEWTCADTDKIKREKGRTYVLTGWVRVKGGEAQLKINGFKEDQWLDHVLGENITSPDWQQFTVTLEPSALPDATHISACAVGLGEVEADFDDLILIAK